ncbi:MAG: hypothetical protein FP824_02465, partial [Euryarchaeota archaeon]|nr:hypothetical protein [Euryarchaeota archaeon]
MAFNEFRKSMRILFGYYDVHDFSNLEKGTRDEALQQLLTIRQSPRINSKWTMELQQLSKILFQSKDDHARFFGSQIKLISSGPEILRSNVYEDCNLLKSIDEPFKNNYSQGLTSNDYPSGDAVYALYQNSQAYHHLLMSMEKDVGTVNFNEAIHALKTTGIEIERNHCPLKNMYGLFSKYSNRPVKDS